ncbi:MAG: hypothetical protein K6T83_07950 [Alicyclobacillus sp.]|nr:hypothetical protein [Alicyclobacillus sp.]
MEPKSGKIKFTAMAPKGFKVYSQTAPTGGAFGESQALPVLGMSVAVK